MSLISIEIMALDSIEMLWLLTERGILDKDTACQFFTNKVDGECLAGATTQEMLEGDVTAEQVAGLRAFLKSVEGWVNPDPVPKESEGYI